MNTISIEDQQLLTKDGFIERFEADLALKKGKTYQQIFNELNLEYCTKFGRIKYSHYESFRKVRSRKIRLNM
jgi:hypothetical protein